MIWPVDLFLLFIHIERTWEKVFNSRIMTNFGFSVSIVTIPHLTIGLSFTAISLHFDKLRKLRSIILFIAVLIRTSDSIHPGKRVVCVDFLIF